MQKATQFRHLLSPIKMGDILFPHRIAMAALTRQRTDKVDGIPNDLMVEYYTQRSNAAFILSEASPVSLRCGAYPGAPGIHNELQMEGWKRVVDGVHKAGGLIFMQIYHSGSATHSTLQNGLEAWAPSAIRKRMWNVRANLDSEIPHAMTLQEVKQVIEEFTQAAVRAKKAGFDGIQLHGANGYLVDMFLRSSSNKRTDVYGGSQENRSRFCLEIIDNLIDIFGPKRTGIKISPIGHQMDMFDSDPIQLYSYLLKELDKRNVGFIEVKEDDDAQNSFNFGYPASKIQINDIYSVLRPFYSGLLVGNCKFTPEKAEQYIQEGKIDMVTFGKLYISNPDLAQRVSRGQQINSDWDVKTFYTPDKEGYTDYLTHEQSEQKKYRSEN